MMRLVIIFLLSLNFPLLQGNYQLHASTDNHDSHYAHLNTLTTTQARLDVTEINQAVLSNASLPYSTDETLTAEELEDDENIMPSRKYVKITNYFLTLFYNSLSGTISLHQKNRLPFCKHFSYFSSPKYIVQRVIRI
jgi:hypothetical protein